MRLTRMIFGISGLLLSASMAMADEQKSDMNMMMEKFEKAGAPGE